MWKRLTPFVVLGLAASVLATPAAAQTVDLELSLVADVSGSVSATEFNLQRTGYVNAFNSPSLWNAISSGALGRIAANLIYFGTNPHLSVGWMLIDSQAAAQAFAAAIAAAPRPEQGSTGIGNALVFATTSTNTNTFQGTRQVIDVSGDGCTNTGTPSSTGRAIAVANGIDAINGLVIQPSNPCDFSAGNVLQHYQNEVVTAGGFVQVADDFADFEAAVDRKLIREITGTVPEPGSIVLFASGLLGLAGVGLRRRRRNQLAD